MMIISGGFQMISGLVAIFKDNFYVVTDRALVAFDITTWGWVHFLMGLIIFLAGASLLNGAVWARVLAVLLACVSLFANMAFMPVYPLWATLIMVVDALILYALLVHGDELRR
ncbi:hypothetical protein KDA23_01125 [Candidatus Saccharibacteria bacterium]|nr:hypothetical protein [Candidatus Saccharibacteria bacterium]